MRKFYVYILTNKTNHALYIGVTNNLVRRLWEHKNKLVKRFTKKYNCTKLIYFEETNSSIAAIEREKQLKRWHRAWKINLIEQTNPEWKDLSEEIGLF